MTIDEVQKSMIEFYGDGSDGATPHPTQWARILRRDPDLPLTLINFFKFREIADYGSPHRTVSGKEAFDRYAEVSIPTMERVGGSFLLVAPFEATFIGPDESWDLVAVGTYPNQAAFLGLYRDTEYRDAFRHRTAACERQMVFLTSG